MKMALTPEQRSFCAAVDEFLGEALDAAVSERVKRGAAVAREDVDRWTQALNERGWAAPSWPEDAGGPGWSLIERHLFDVACRAAHAPVQSGITFNMVGSAIAKFGTEEQKASFLPRILRGELNFAQGYSEPQAGSDLASLSTRADKEGDDYIVNGQKIWTSGAESADWIFILVRTNHEVQQQKGISFLLLDLKSPGVTVRPLYAFNGKRLWNQVFFEDVRVPMTQRLGDEDRGWTVAKSLLGDERLFVSRVAENKRILSMVREAIDWQASRGVSLPDSLVRAVDEIEVRLTALEMTSLRILTEADRGGEVGAEPSMLKLKGSQLIQAQDELLFELMDHLALAADGSLTGDLPVNPPEAEYVASGMYHHRGYTIAGGSSEVQMNIIAKQVLGL